MKHFLFYFILLAMVGMTWFLPAHSSADYYKYTDNRGTVNITNKLESVPARYRSTMKVVREEKKKAPAAEQQSTGAEQQAVPALEQQAVPEPERKPDTAFSRLCGRFVWLKPLLYVMGGLALFVGVIQVASMLASPMLSKLIYISFFFGVFVFLYKAYAEYMVASTAKIKENAVTIMKKSTNRELPALEEGGLPAQR
ncbi:protein of unknown function, DUF4124-containing [Citrifermentans bemidjiense Bem]|uniref:DUF4124 domain-containing protein n=1 Tax=Citrifermentans bemidjiense (strain ATCC BAA-1014 / DSM 16622 / JCM 12645 / Bem) TaxID=404380 RepID=B5EAF8_CITBB|nr:DUF4124 domain-containing protein [Citrifermentans bemidjiense]ACH40297.1 protein of unknown function, DUF4124-containing [Citrifermentans bemidjiense Bem]